uniref:Retrotransposon gag domain-containing protein n=1 Tax=Davidia involucrata TaxID=16924 RepID=A0A5B7C4P1_DAVIN
MAEQTIQISAFSLMFSCLLMFKVPDFTKYDGTECPYTHLKIYCGELRAQGRNEKLRIQLFQKSLKGPALLWFVKDLERIRTWDNLTSLFLNQYKFNIELAPDRFDLQRLTKNNSESFREYAQRWRETAAQVQPHLDEREMVSTFIHTLPSFYFSQLFTCIEKSFSNLIWIGEMLDDGVRTGKIKMLET